MKTRDKKGARPSPNRSLQLIEPSRTFQGMTVSEKMTKEVCEDWSELLKKRITSKEFKADLERYGVIVSTHTACCTLN